MNGEFTAQARKEVKRACRKRVTGNWGRCIGIQVLYTLPFILLALILYIAVFGRAVSMIARGYVDEYRIGLAVMQGMNSIWVVLFFMLLIGGPLQYGIMQFYIRLRRGGEPGVGTLFAPFTALSSVWMGIRMACCLFFRALLWKIGPTVVYTVLLMMAAVNAALSGRVLSDGTALLLGLLYGVVIFLIDVKLTAYQAGWVLLCDRKEDSAWDAAANASRAFKGEYGRLLVFQLSFIGWYLLLAGVILLCFGIGAAGAVLLPGAMGAAVCVAAVVAALCLYIVLGSFVTAYVNTSFIGMYESVAVPAAAPGFPPEGGDGSAPQDGSGQ